MTDETHPQEFIYVITIYGNTMNITGKEHRGSENLLRVIYEY